MRYLFFDFKSVYIPLSATLLGCVVLLCTCRSDNSSEPASENHIKNTNDTHSAVHHAVGFDLLTFGDFKILRIISHDNETADTLSYVLKEKEAVLPVQLAKFPQIEIPVERIALLHSSYVSYFDFCETKDHIKAISEIKYVYDSTVYFAARSGLLAEVGYGETLDKEKLLELGIELVITVGFPNVPNKSRQVLEELGIPVLVFSDWQESTLLGRAEWVKVIAALTDSDKLCEEKFSRSEEAYEQLVSRAEHVDTAPKVICNLPYKGSWYVPGGDSYMSHVLEDAGADYLWSEEEGTGGIQIDFETAYANGLDADYWLNTDLADRIDEITDRDERMADFAPIQSGKVFNNNNRTVRGGANDYWESGIVRPEIILADMIKIFHPELLQEHQLYYYKQLP
jgi:iron complex transport system substrate-binding protein